MSRKHMAFSIALFVLTLTVTAITEAQTMNAEQALSAKQKSIVPIAAFTAIGDHCCPVKELKIGLKSHFVV